LFESAFERLGRISRKNSGKIIIGWVIIILISLPFSTALFGLTSYDIAKGIVSSNSMAVKASNLLSEYFPSAAPSTDSGNSTIILTTGTDVNNAEVISDYLTTQSLIEKFLSGQGISGNITSIVTIERQTMLNFSSSALMLMNGTTALIHSINLRLTTINETLRQTVGLLYGVPSLFLTYLKATDGDEGIAYNLTLENITGEGTAAIIYFRSFLSFFNQTSYQLPVLERANYSVAEAIFNSTSSFATLLNADLQFKFTVLSVYSNFSFSDFNLDSTSNMTHFDNYAYNFMSSEIVPGLSSQNATSLLLLSLNITGESFFSDVMKLPQPANADETLLLASHLVSAGLATPLEYNPLLYYRPSVLPGYLIFINGTSDLSNAVLYFMQTTGFSGYPVVPSEYLYHDFVGTDDSTTLIVLSTNKALSAQQTNLLNEVVQSGFSTVGGAKFYIAGSNEMDQQLAQQTTSGLTKALFIGIVLSIIIVGIYFRSLIAAFLPLGIFSVSALTAFSANGLLYKYVLKSQVSFITPTLLLILLLGLSTDYVVYIMSRYRREIVKGNPNPEISAGKWAGHAVFTSGITVALSYVALWLSNVPLFSDSGITNAIGVIIAVIAANTLLLAILNRGGRKLFWPSGLRPSRKNFMSNISSRVIRHKAIIFIIFVIVSIASLTLYASTPTNLNVFALLPQSSGIKAVVIVNQTFGGDYFDQSFAIIHFPSPIISSSGYNETEMAEISAIELYLSHQSQISYVYGPTFPFGYYLPYNLSGIPLNYQAPYRQAMLKYIGTDSSYALITFQLSSLSWLPSTYNYVNTLPARMSNIASNAHVYIGGLAEGLNNAYAYTSQSFDRMLPVLTVAIFAILALQLSSAFTPLRLILMVLASVVIALSITYLIVHYYYALPVIIFLPMFTVVTLLAVGLDYDIFMVSRVREEVLNGRRDEEGIRTSMEENGTVIITLGAILFATFGALFFSGLQIMEEIGAGLAFGVLIDTFVSWPFFVPSVMLYLKRLNWWPARISGNAGR